MMPVMIVMIVTMADTADGRRRFVAVLALGHAQLLRRLCAELTGRSRAIAARHLLRKIRFRMFAVVVDGGDIHKWSCRSRHPRKRRSRMSTSSSLE